MNDERNICSTVLEDLVSRSINQEESNQQLFCVPRMRQGAGRSTTIVVQRMCQSSWDSLHFFRGEAFEAILLVPTVLLSRSS